ncbi:MAG: hypothetical protein HUK21_02155, partial [Fibrobacteraceae bacterium]|nr:hypothetical protein [Fibrobacteraceae bacterium]
MKDYSKSLNRTPQYNGNISRMVNSLAHSVNGASNQRDVYYTYDMMNRLERV